ncbi:hypothetical protein OAY12_01700 [Candidatus Pelagibacter sp.]|nr:hypothetical protein [Candidatus Pelagibacter sp.]|tara:strand:- start:224 stop:673 length:450 start_codon:yes stop_codon:yes gene_type:complete
MKRLFILILFFMASCGYQPLYVNKDSSDLVFNKIELFGDKEINRRIISFISIKEDKSVEKLNQIVLRSNEDIIETSKDSKGRVATLKTTVEIKLVILNGNQIIKEKTFNENFSYNNKNNKFDLEKYQIEIKNNLVDKIIEQMSIYLSLK